MSTEQFNVMRKELVENVTGAALDWLAYMGTDAALAAIPDTEPPRYVVAGTLADIVKLLPAAEVIRPAKGGITSIKGLTRYTLMLDGMEYDHGMDEDDAGEWVKFADVERLLASTAGEQAKPLTDEAIDRVFGEMPGGVDGWLKQFGYRQFARAIARHVLVRVAASMAGTIRPTDDELWEQTIGERDCYHEWADKLAEAIAKHFGAEIGEHSNMNCPWAEALDVIQAAPAAPEQVQAEPIAMVSADELRDIQSCRMGVPVRGAGWRKDQTIALYLAAPIAAAPAAPSNNPEIPEGCPAPAAEEVRNQILDEVADRLEAMNDASGDAAAYDNREQNLYELEREHAIANCVKAVVAMKRPASTEGGAA